MDLHSEQSYYETYEAASNWIVQPLSMGADMGDMAAQPRSSNEIVVRDSRPLQAVLIGFYGLVLVWWAIWTPRLGAPLLVVWVALTVVAYRRPRHLTVANADGITGLRIRVPRADRRSWFARHKVIRSVTPWSQVESFRIESSAPSLSTIRVRLADGREADLGADAITRRGLRKIASELDHLRATFA